MKIVSFKICPFVQRVTALLEAKGIKYDIEYISLADKPQWFLDVSPHGQVPILITDDDQIIFESEAIVEYIDDISAPLQAELTAVQKANNRAWGYLAAKTYLPQCSAMRSSSQSDLIERQNKLNKTFVKLENALTGGCYFNGEQLSNVDIAWLPILHRVDIIFRHSGYDLLAGFEKVKQWQQNILKLDIVQQSVADDFENKFTDFYLSDKTYLGSGMDNCVTDTCATGTCC